MFFALLLLHDTRHKILGVLNSAQDQLDVHLRLTELPRTLAINPMLAHQYQGIRQHIHRYCEPASGDSHLRLESF